MKEFEYTCANCHTLSTWKHTVNVKTKRCPNCKRKKLSRVWIIAGIHFHGAGYTRKLG